jgi:hypothetical protein
MRKVGDNSVLYSKLLVVDEYEKAKVTPVTILDRILMKKSNKTATIGLTHWSNLFEEDAI